MKRIVALLLVFSSSFAFGQSSKTLYFSDKGVDIYLEFKDCINTSSGVSKQYLLIEIQNTTTKSVTVSFDKEYWYDNVCQTCNSNSSEYKTTLTIPANSNVSGNCNSKGKSLKIFSKMLNLNGVRELTKYELKNIHIENIK